MEHQLFIIKTMLFVKSSLILLTLRGVFEGTINYDCIFTLFLSKVPSFCQLYDVFLKVPSILTAYLQQLMLPGSMHGAEHRAKPLYQDRENPYR